MGNTMVNTAPLLSVLLAAVIVPPMTSTKPREIASPSPVSPHRIRLVDAIELVEYLLELARRNASAFIEDLQANGIVLAPFADPDGRSDGGVFRRIIEQIE